MVERRAMVGAVMTGSVAVLAATAMPQGEARPFVFASGSWHGGWCWARIAERLRAAGHRCFTPSYTGMGDRAHSLSKSITLDTFVQDLVAVIETEELQNVVLVGHSFAGAPISGVADRIPERIAHLVYLDAVLIESGSTLFGSVYDPAEAHARIDAARDATDGLAVPVPAELPAVWGLTGEDAAWVKRRLTPHPLGTYTTPLTLRRPIGNGRPRSYVTCTAPTHPGLARSKALVEGLSGWHRVNLDAPHDAMVTHPRELAELLMRLGTA